MRGVKVAVRQRTARKGKGGEDFVGDLAGSDVHTGP